MVHTESKKTTAADTESVNNVLLKIQAKNKVSGSDNNHLFPILKISPAGRIIYANRSAYPLLKVWNCYASNIIPQNVLIEFPVLTSLTADDTIVINSEIERFYFSVVGFPDGDYIGIYGYKTELATDQVQNN